MTNQKENRVADNCNAVLVRSEADDVQFLLVGNRIGFQPLRDLQVLLRRGIAFKIPV